MLFCCLFRLAIVYKCIMFLMLKYKVIIMCFSWTSDLKTCFRNQKLFLKVVSDRPVEPVWPRSGGQSGPGSIFKPSFAMRLDWIGLACQTCSPDRWSIWSRSMFELPLSLMLKLVKRPYHNSVFGRISCQCIYKVNTRTGSLTGSMPDRGLKTLLALDYEANKISYCWSVALDPFLIKLF